MKVSDDYSAGFTKKQIDCFLKKVDASDVSGCWTWKGTRIKNGYGRFEYNGNKLAHRVCYAMFVGPLENKLVLHACDNRACVRPNHLFLGTMKDNVIDMLKKGRWKDRWGSHGKATCRRGHKSEWLTETKKKECKQCKRITAKRRYHDKRISGTPQRPVRPTI